MRQQTRRVAVCGVLCALGVVIQVLGGLTGIGTYLCPMVVGVLLLPVGRAWGARYQLLLAAAIGLVSLFLVVDLEETLMFLGFFGWYPALRPRLEKLPKAARAVVKCAVFNAAVIALEALLLLVLLPESDSPLLLLALLFAGNVVFLLYDRMLPSVEERLFRRLEPVLR